MRRDEVDTLFVSLVVLALGIWLIVVLVLRS